jgi:photosystem II stability/assembly factor-like uncharacterized protein
MLSHLFRLPALLLILLFGAPPVSVAPVAAQENTVVNPSLYEGMSYRMVGPFRGGRVTAVTGIAEEPHTFFFGGTGGGVWKTDDAGHHWTPIADDFLTAGAVGAIDVADSDPNVIYVGTGSTCIRGNVSVGRGVWRTTDGGDSWSHIGLPESGAVGNVVIHPQDPDLVYVAALGHPFGKNPDRGIYRSRDGGTSWENVLFLNDSTGAASLAMDPSNPRILYAGMWRAERKPWGLISGGPEGGLYKSTDAGDSWTKLGGGLPEGIVGKVMVSISRANPDRIWAMVEAEPGNGLYRSDDGGESWAFMNGESNLTGRAFYYHHVIADPGDENTVYILNTRFYRSVDGGETFEMIPVHHGDVHDLWINPLDPEIFVVGDDGGAEVSLNGGRTLSGVYNQPTAELYDVMVDNEYPYRLYGSQQDNSTIIVPSSRGANNLRPQEDWAYAAGCEVGPIAFDPDNPDVIWGGCYGGLINRMVVSTDDRRNMNLYPEAQTRAPNELKNRFQWIAPIVMDPHDGVTVYHASQYVHRTRDGGMNWETISPDLTTNTPEHQEYPGGPIHADHTGVEVFNTIFALTPSPHTPGTIWVGSDDGRVHVTQDDGESWTDITPPGMPQFGTVNRIEVSPHQAGRAFVAVQRYRMDDWRPYIFQTDDFGESWDLLTDGTNGIPEDHWVRVVREDTEVKGLLYAGTEFGAFVSFDDGTHWQPLQMNLPATPVTDMKVHRGDLVLSTQGRSFWILDDVTPLRELAQNPGTEAAHLFTPRDISRGLASPPMSEVDLNLPAPLPSGALLSYAISLEVKGMTLALFDAVGDTVAVWVGGGRRGLSSEPGFHRLAWPVRYSTRGGVKAPPGEYTLRLSWEGGSQERSFRVLPNPKTPTITQADYLEQFRVTMEVYETSREVTETLGEMNRVTGQAEALLANAREADRDVGKLAEIWEGVNEGFAALKGELTNVDDPRVPAHIKRPEGVGLSQDYRTLVNYLNGGGGYGGGSVEGRPTEGAMNRKADLDALWATLKPRVEKALEEGVTAFNAEVERLGLEGIVRR